MNLNFKRRCAFLSQTLARFDRRLRQVQNLRLLIGLGLFALFVLMASFPQQKLWLLLAMVFSLVFTVLVVRSRKLKKHIHRLSLWHDFYQRQEQKQEAHFSAKEAFAADFLSDEQRWLSDDLHLFGSRSLFSYLDECMTDGGRLQLARQLLGQSPQTSSEDSSRPSLQWVQEQQSQVQNIRKERWLLIKTLLIGKSEKGQIEASTLIEELGRPFVEAGFKKIFAFHLVLFPLCGLLIFLGLTGHIELSAKIPLGFYMIFSLSSLKWVQMSFSRLNKVSYEIGKILPLMQHLESVSQRTAFAEHLKHVAKAQASGQLKTADRFIGLLNVRNHPLLYLMVNAICPWDLTINFFAERWRKQVADDIHEAFEELYNFDRLLSIAIFSLHQTQTWPEFQASGRLSFEELGHPLIKKEDRVSNSFSLGEDHRLCLITGSNMSGKSTFMRTIAVNQILAMMGAPVFAQSFSTHLTEIQSCLKVTDNLESGYSTFYFEVKRVAQILNQSQSNKGFLFFIDEIFRGTNHRERIEGSRAIIAALAQCQNAIGFISTHDHELIELAEQFDSIGVWHFRDDMVNGELSFSYKIQPGPCPTTNAIKIMAAAGLPVNTP